LFPSFSTDVVEILVSFLFYGCSGNSCFPPFLRTSLSAPPGILGFSMSSIYRSIFPSCFLPFQWGEALLVTCPCCPRLNRLAAFCRSPFLFFEPLPGSRPSAARLFNHAKSNLDCGEDDQLIYRSRDRVKRPPDSFSPCPIT
jgi:hypothetical protein